MVCLNKKSFIVINHGIVSSDQYLQIVVKYPYIRIPTRAGINKCTGIINGLSLPCYNKIGVLVLFLDCNPHQETPQYLKTYCTSPVGNSSMKQELKTTSILLFHGIVSLNI